MRIAPGYKATNAEQQAGDLMRHPEVRAALEQARDRMKAAISESIELTSQRTLAAIARCAYFDPRCLVDAEGIPRPLQDLDEDEALAIAGFDIDVRWETDSGGRRRKVTATSYKLSNRIAALDQAARILGLYRTDNEQRRSTRDMTDDELRLRALTLLNGTPPVH